ncbi:MAG TPA: hypothetical protein VG206_05565 [Terriglobia bacterium]|nr:hypothetical protein [Terriglobia bacterium]
MKKKAEAHLRLAEGFIKTAEVRGSCSEFEIRNAFSRVYYALFHACYAHLLGIGTDAAEAEEIARDHGRLHSSMRQPIGKQFERFLRDAYERRRQSDYRPEWAVPAFDAVREELKRATTQFYWLLSTTRSSLRDH